MLLCVKSRVQIAWSYTLCVIISYLTPSDSQAPCWINYRWKRKPGKKNPGGKRQWHGVAVSFIGKGMQISRGWGDGGRHMVGWWVSATAVPCLWAETQHTFETLVWCSSKKPAKLHYPWEKLRKVFGHGFLCRTRMDRTQPQPGAASGVAILPRRGLCPQRRGLSPFPYLWAERLWGWHPALVSALPRVWRQPLLMAPGRGMTSWRQWEGSVILR